jgi:sulfoxide reductase heme-binding subunit YedZ
VTDVAWFVGRGTGVVTLLLLTVVCVLGIATRRGQPAFALPRFGVAAVHRNASLCALCLLTVHVATMVIDPYAQIRLVDVVVPFAAAYRPLWVGFGTLALDLLLVLVATSLLRRRIGLRGWRAVHWLAYAAWPTAFVHGLQSGTDGRSLWYLALSLLCGIAITVAVGWRLSAGFTGGRAGSKPAVPLADSNPAVPLVEARGGTR